MSFQVILGKPGAGKSYEAVQRAYEAVDAGRVVVTSLPLKEDHPFWVQAEADGLLYRVLGERADGDGPRFGQWSTWENYGENPAFIRDVKSGKNESSRLGPLFIVDEGLVTFQKLRKEKRKSDEWDKLTAYLAVHRHNLVDILIMFHDHGQMDGDMKQVVELYHHVINTSKMSGMNTFVVKSANKGYLVGKNHQDGRAGRFKKEIYALYDSYSEGSGSGTTGKKSEVGMKKGRPLWMRWWFILIVIAVLVFPWFMFKAVKGIIGVTQPDEPISGFGGGGSVVQTFDINAPIAAPLAAPRPASPASKLGWPDPSVAMMGFDNEVIYFADGSSLNLDSDISASGWIVAEATLCRLTLAKISAPRSGPTEVGLIQYRCSKGF